LARFVAGGGVLVMSFFSGIVDESDHVWLGGYPAPFAEMLGLRVDDFLPLAAGERVPLAFGDGAAGEGELWSELVRPRGAAVLATFAGGDLDGWPAVTRNAFGEGAAYYLATRPDAASLARLLDAARAEAGVEAVAATPAGVEAVRRQTGDGGLLFLLNHGTADVEVAVPADGVDLLTGRPAS